MQRNTERVGVIICVCFKVWGNKKCLIIKFYLCKNSRCPERIGLRREGGRDTFHEDVHGGRHVVGVQGHPLLQCQHRGGRPVRRIEPPGEAGSVQPSGIRVYWMVKRERVMCCSDGRKGWI